MTKFIENICKVPSLSYESNPPFGKIQVPIILSAEITKEVPIPAEAKIEDLTDLRLNPFCSALHYGQSIFEGMKAFRLSEKEVGIFRLQDHVKRFIRSAQIMCMPTMNEDMLTEAIKKYVQACHQLVPKEEGHALYLRPLMYASDNVIKVRSSENFNFLIMSAIVGDYFGGAIGKSTSKVLVSKKFVRAFPGGTGEAKTAANYAQSLFALEYAINKGYQQVLYLDAVSHTKFEELGGMNLFWVKNNELYTPKLNGQILHGITRQSIIEIANFLNIKVHQVDLTLQELLEGHKDGSITEVFASGTAAVITPLGEIGVENEDGTIQNLSFPNSPTAWQIRKILVDSHIGKTEFSEKWLEIIKLD